MVCSFACVILIAIASSSDSTEQPSATEAPLSLQDGTNAAATREDTTTTSMGCFWLGVSLCLCHAWLFSAIGVTSRRLQHVHFTELMIHQSVQGVILSLSILAALVVLGHENPLGKLTAR